MFVGVSIDGSIELVTTSLSAPVALITIVSGISIAPVSVSLARGHSHELFDILSIVHGTKRAIQSNEVFSVTGT